MTKQIATLVGSARDGSLNQRLFKAVQDMMADDMSLFQIEGMRNLPIYSQEIEERGMPGEVTQMADQIRAADALMIITPEYNYSIPGPLKNQIDWMSRVEDQPFEAKPVSLMSCSPSPMGGVRAQYHLRDVFVALGGRLVNRPEVAVADAQNRLSEDGKITHDQTKEIVERHLDVFAKLIDERL
ncbi:MAG: NADPH-dependent FMN reductase [Pseudomonadota bacterium]